jgi:hypothetical protein
LHLLLACYISGCQVGRQELFFSPAGRYTTIGWNIFPKKAPKSGQQLWQTDTFFHWMTPDNKLHLLKALRFAALQNS